MSDVRDAVYALLVLLVAATMGFGCGAMGGLVSLGVATLLWVPFGGVNGSPPVWLCAVCCLSVGWGVARYVWALLDL